ncbi:MAG: PAS domain-containing protein, partial [Anaerolineae bacterium]|nr:PAS domain-containing protein [Anaerolineae bacterium]
MIEGADQPAGAPRHTTSEGSPEHTGDASAQGPEQLLASVLSASPALICAHDRAGRCLYASPAAAQALGFQPGEMVGKTWRELGLQPEVAALHDALREQVFATAQPAVAELPFPTVQGLGTCECTLRPVAGPDGTVQMVVATGVDVTERKRVEATLMEARDGLEVRVQERTAELRRTIEALAAERRLFRDVLDVLPAYVALLTPDYRVSFANLLFRERFGESHGRRCYEYLFMRSEPCEDCETYRALQTGA